MFSLNSCITTFKSGASFIFDKISVLRIQVSVLF
jgi:hypothetical protein